MDFTKFVEWAFMGLVSAAGTAVCYLLWNLLNSIRDLNVQIAVIIERTARQKESIDNMGERVAVLEKRKQK